MGDRRTYSARVDTTIVRRMWHLFEPIHDVTYFAPETRQAGMALGLKGFWMTYFAFRAAPLGPASPAVVTAPFFGFHPSWVERALPNAWQRTTPAAALTARQASAAGALSGIAGGAGITLDDVEATADLLWDISRTCDTAGRTLAAANRAVARPEDPLERLWQACTVLRGHRGDGHLAALLVHGLGPVEANALKVAAGESDRAQLQASRGWPDQSWDDADTALTARGLITTTARGTTLTTQGRTLKDQVEEATDRLALAPWRSVEPDVIEDLTTRLGPLAQAVRASEHVPDANPVGLGRRQLAPDS